MTDAPAPADRPVLRLQPGREKRVLTGYPWVFSNELQTGPALREAPIGGLARLEAANGRPLGVAGVNRHALIAARVVSRDPDATVDASFLAARLRAAVELRERLFDRPFYRAVHAEADHLPGLVVDRYGDALVVQQNAAVMDRLTAPLLDALEAVLAPATIVLRNDSPARVLEGLEPEVRVARGDLDGPIALEENGAAFLADPLGGQKTGWFFDQRANRAFVARLARGRTALDVFSHTGGFAVTLALAGATKALAVDRSGPALELAAEAARRNGVGDRVECRRADAFDEMQRLRDRGESFGVVVVDPPAFVKAKRDLKPGLQGYRKMVRLAARLVEPGGILFAASCSHHVDPVLFAEAVARGLADAGRTGRILRQAGAGPDHPVHPFLPESAYLKAQVAQLD